MKINENIIWTDVTNLMNVDFLTGIQRVVREIVIRMLRMESIDLKLLCYDEAENCYRLLDNDIFYEYFAGKNGDKKEIMTKTAVQFTDIPSGSVFFDIDSVWNSRLKRSWLFPLLKQKGVKIVTQVYDIIPITHPQFAHENTCMNFMVYIGANIEYADLLIVSAQATVDALDKLCDDLGRPRKKCIVVPLGADFSVKAGEGEISDEVRDAALGKYILMVGTIEPRKNHSLVIDALENGLDEMGIRVIFAGRYGWNVDALRKRIETHPMLGKSLFFLERPDDAAIDYLYKNALAVAFPTFNEGFGLPMIEAFSRNTPVLASDIGVLREVGGSYADYFDPTDSGSFIEAVKKLASDEKMYAAKKERLKEYVPLTWDKCACLFADAVLSVCQNRDMVPDDTKVKQMVCLTARNDDILATLPFLEKYMPFITEMVICCPDKNVEELREKYKGRFALKFLTDSQVLNGAELPADHQTRNFFLRCLIMKNPVIDDVFIMTDDDYRPLREVDIPDFISSGRYKAYYCYDLNEWGGTYGAPTSFDLGMKHSREFLSANGYPTMMYSSHQPQIIDKRIFNEMTEKYPEITTKGVCEWCSYFNYGVGTYPDKFDAVPYISMCWPGACTDWKLYTLPDEYVFENHYSSLYEKGHIFYGLSDRAEDDCGGLIEEKKKRYAAELGRQMEARRVYEQFVRQYRASRGEMPSFTIAASPDRTGIVINSPDLLRLKSPEITRLQVTVDKNIIDEMNVSQMSVSYWYTSVKNEQLTGVFRTAIDNSDLNFLLPMRTPSKKCGAAYLHFVVTLEDRQIQQSVTIRTELV